jgi:hypothetical protein
MEKRLMRYLAALDAAAKQSDALIATLEKEARQDEANLEKIRRNVYGIFAALANADWAQAQKEQNPEEAFSVLHSQRFERFPEPWRQRLAKAQAHGDVVTQTVEETKLKTVAQLWQIFQETEEEP